MESKQIVQKSLLEQENPKDLHFLSSSLVYTVTNKNKPVSKVWLCGCLFSSQACFLNLMDWFQSIHSDAWQPKRLGRCVWIHLSVDSRRYFELPNSFPTRW